MNKNSQILFKLNDSDLEKSLQSQVIVEREATTSVLHHLREFEKRRLYARRGYSSLFEYATKKLGYSESQAQRRISASRLLGELPELEEKITSGDLNLSTLSQAQSFFRQETKAKNTLSRSEKFEVLKKLENQSARRADQILVALSSEPPKPKDSVRSVAGGLTEYCFYADQETVANLERLKEIWSAKMSGASWSQIIAAAIEVARRHSDPYEKAQAKEERKSQKTPTNPQKCRSAYSTSPVNLQNVPSLRQITIESGQSIPESQQNAFGSKPHTAGSDQNASRSRQHTSGSQQNSFRSKQNPSEAKQNLSAIKAKRSRYLSVSLKNRVRIRDQDQCTYVDPGTHVRCASRYALQFDHIHLYSKGGEHSEENLRLRCQTHNLLEAWDKIGAEKMRAFIQFSKIN